MTMLRRFIIRDLLWLTLVVALVVGWWLDHRALERRLEKMQDEQIRSLYTITTVYREGGPCVTLFGKSPDATNAANQR